MTKRRPAYAGLVNKHLRFYFSNPSRIVFETSVDEKQFKAVEKVVRSFTKDDFELLKFIVTPKADHTTGDSYINENIERAVYLYGCNRKELYTLFTQSSKNIAIQLEYIPKERR